MIFLSLSLFNLLLRANTRDKINNWPKLAQQVAQSNMLRPRIRNLIFKKNLKNEKRVSKGKKRSKNSNNDNVLSSNNSESATKKTKATKKQNQNVSKSNSNVNVRVLQDKEIQQPQSKSKSNQNQNQNQIQNQNQNQIQIQTQIQTQVQDQNTNQGDEFNNNKHKRIQQNGSDGGTENQFLNDKDFMFTSGAVPIQKNAIETDRHVQRKAIQKKKKARIESQDNDVQPAILMGPLIPGMTRIVEASSDKPTTKPHNK